MKTTTTILSIVFFLIFSSILFAQDANNEASITAKKNWESAELLTTSESVCYYPENKDLFVACINGKPLDKDGKGFIAKLSLTGDIVVLKWITGLNAPKGMGIFNNFLYVTDIDRVIKISIKDEEVVKEFQVEGAQFLNDITVDPDGNIYISDMSTNQIHRIHKDEIDTYYSNDKIIKPNGLAFENGKLLIGTKNGIFSLSPKDKQLIHLVKNTGGIDGLEPDGNGNYIISDWSGKVQLVHPDKKAIILFDTSNDGINAADICYIADRELLLVPTFFNNRVTAYYIHYN